MLCLFSQRKFRIYVSKMKKEFAETMENKAEKQAAAPDLGSSCETHLHKMKCLSCSLHFVVCSWSADWFAQHENKCFCPECGSTGSKIHWISTTDDPIFAIVPGGAHLDGIYPRRE